jgi:hypothetical protein
LVTETEDINIYEFAELWYKVLNVDAGSAVHVRGPFTGEDRCAHAGILGEFRDR